MKITAEPRSDQWNADDFIGGKAKVFTIAGVKNGTAEQKYDIRLEGQDRVWRPPLTVLRILMAAWGDESDDWIGRRVALYREPTVTFGKEKTGGIRVSHMSDLPNNAPFTTEVTISRARKQQVTVKPLPPESKIPSSFDAKIAGSSAEQCVQVREYLAKFESSEPERVAELLKLVAEREAVLSGGDAA